MSLRLNLCAEKMHRATESSPNSMSSFDGDTAAELVFVDGLKHGG